MINLYSYFINKFIISKILLIFFEAFIFYISILIFYILILLLNIIYHYILKYFIIIPNISIK